ncbi:hypothetical protein MUN82_04520 [Hymenobacter aerilatus]|uniref:Nucleotidyltransferase n=1 Tax=Hymenobacter aerilatus TaxID=2932251 RepID=A0A8T9SVZ1_9BACT|nr:hypothetical protein [Hymenobacter aerilatus]UOR06362.1 hypothetical protein MUN82_04520 [Hymenobacter aerilatus]
MALSINGLLRELAYEYYISYDSQEDNSIKTSLTNISGKLRNEFGTKLISVSDFGSYKRDTILPRAYDSGSDVDIMVKFNHATLAKTPDTYRTWLLAFADKHFSRSSVYRDFPTVVVELGHIKFDLVPAYEVSYWSTSTLYIPDSRNEWQSTDPSALTADLTRVNTHYGSIVKPIIRLLKAWNTRAGKPYSSYELEKAIININFSGDNYQTGFFYAINQLSDYGKPQWAKEKIATLKKYKGYVEAYLYNNDMPKALLWLYYILPPRK